MFIINDKNNGHFSSHYPRHRDEARCGTGFEIISLAARVCNGIL